MPLGRDVLAVLRGVRFAYPDGTEALRGVDLDLAAGERVALVGVNGSGKTTLARLLLGLLRPAEGTVRVGGRDPARADRPWMAAQAGLVFQNPDHQLFANTVWEEVAFGPRARGLEGEALAPRVEEELRRFRLSGTADRLPVSLSGGERKQVAFAAVHATRPRLLLLDEPTKGMDAGRKRDLAAFAREETEAGHTVVFVTHDLAFALEATDRCVVLHRGRVALDGPTADVLADPRLEEAGLLPPSLARLGALLRDRGAAEPLTSLARLQRWLEGGP